jgi:hypothetical protein
MNTSKSKPLAKVFGPVLLLSAALALPVDSFAAPSPRERNAHADKADKNERKGNRGQAQSQAQKRNQKQEARPNRQRNEAQNNNQAQERRAAAQRQADLNRQRAAERQAAKQQAEVRRQSERQRQAEVNRRAESQRLKKQYEQTQRDRRVRESRQAELNRQAEINRRAQLQQQAELNRRAELQRRADLQRRTELQRRNNAQRYATPRNRFYDRSNNRYQNYAGGRSWGRGDTIAVDGHLTNEGYQCQALRDDNGDLYMLVGNTYGLRNGDHARVVGRVVDGGHCDWEGIAFEVTDVTALWADRRHQTVYYHHSYDGGRFGDRDNWMGRRPRQFQNKVERYGYYDRDNNRYDDRYRDDGQYYDDRNGKRQMIIREGRVANNRGCPVLVSGNDQFGLTGNLGNLRNGDDVKVTGFLEGPSRCAGKTIRVGEISGR